VLDPDDDAWREMNKVGSALVQRTREGAPWEEARSVGPVDVWTPELRSREHRIMGQALDLASAAIQALEEAHGIISR
jgi:hypothetical protein